jgi:hypothetical protein
MSNYDTRLRWLRTTARHYLDDGFCYEHVRSIIWFSSDVLGCNPADVDALCRSELIDWFARNRPEPMTSRTVGERS